MRQVAGCAQLPRCELMPCTAANGATPHSPPARATDWAAISPRSSKHQRQGQCGDLKFLPYSATEDFKPGRSHHRFDRDTGSWDYPTCRRTTRRQRATSGRYLLLLATFTAAIFVSAALLFMVQPMFTKMVLPRLGGAPSVWSVAIVFFQAALLAGYAYAHWLTRYAPGRPSVVIHLVVMIAAVFALPLSIAAGWGRPPESGEAFWLIGPVRGLDRPAVLCARRQQPAAAGLVRAHRSSGRERPLFPLCRQQYRKLPRAGVLSDA